jgi:hypothetical protein
MILVMTRPVPGHARWWRRGADWSGKERLDMMSRPHNNEIADVLFRVAALLEAQRASQYRVRAYRNAAKAVRAWPRPVALVYQAEGIDGLDRIPGVGQRISTLIQGILLTGRCPLLDRLEGQVSPEDLFATLPGVGDALAHRIHHELDIETLEELEVTAHDGRLERVFGVGERRAAMIRRILDSLLSRSARRMARRLRWFEGGNGPHAELHPPVGLLLGVDEEYRQRAAAGELHLVTPRRFNPDHKAWLPILHTERVGWSLTALFSNTSRAHRLHRTDDWVVIYWEHHGHEDQCTVVTERTGPLSGRRVIRGRESECFEHYGVEAGDRVL